MKRNSNRVGKLNFVDIFIYIVISCITLTCLIPILNTIAVSLSDKTSAALGEVFLWPINFTLAAYKDILSDNRYWNAFTVSVIRVVLGTSINTIISILIAYPLSKSKKIFPRRNIFMWLLIFTMLFNGGLVPTFLLIMNLGLIDTIWALVLPGAVNVFNTIILINFFKGIPKSLEEAAYVDGAKPFYILLNLFVPLAKASIATITLFSAVNHWNSFFDGKIYINSPDMIPLQTYIQSLHFKVSATALQYMSPEEIIMRLEMSSLTFNASKAIVAMIPIMIIYPFLQKFFVTGIVMGAVKE